MGKKKMKKTIGIILALLFAGLLTLIIGSPIKNNLEAKKVANAIKECALPERTELLDTVSAAGKLVGNGNGMQYFGAILIKSELSLEELKEYYGKLASDEFQNIVEKQETGTIDFIEHADLSFDADGDYENTYIVYSWGDYSGLASEFDLRGH